MLVLVLLAACGSDEGEGQASASGGNGAETETEAQGDDAVVETEGEGESSEADTGAGQADGDVAQADAGGAQAGAESANQEDDSPYNIWRGERMTFTKEDGADPTVPANQDRITDNVWITRRNDGGQIFNILERDGPLAPVSPIGTRWALGTTDDIENLDFKPFRPAVVSPKEVPGKDVVLHLVEEDIYVDVRFLSWSQEKQGGFSYERTTP